MAYRETFTSRWSLILAAIGMVVGTGNIWRFPRIVAKNGGGAFLIAWLIFLFLWSIPLLMAELAIGKKTRKGTLGSFTALIGPKYTWMGGFVGFCTLAIMFYYSVVMGWCLKFFSSSITGQLNNQHPQIFWNSFITTWQPAFFHIIAISIGAFVVLGGIKKGIEKTTKFLIPLLFILLLISAVRALTLPNAAAGLNFFFTPDWSALKNFKVWLEALSQSAWSTGAGWGLMLTYAVYTRKNEDITVNSFLAGLGNNAASLLVGFAIFPAVFALAPLIQSDPYEIIQATGPANTGMAFIWLPMLFSKLPAQQLFTTLFFLSLSIAALTSLIAMIELGVRNLVDLGLSRKKSILIIWILGLLLGLPSAFNMTFFENQDWVWGIGLIVSGFFITFAVLKYNAGKFRKNLINIKSNDIIIGSWMESLFKYIIPVEFLVLLSWWFFQSIKYFEKDFWWHPFHTYSVGTCLLQWSLIILIVLLFKKTITRKLDITKF